MSEDEDAILQVVDWAGDLLGAFTAASMSLVRRDAAAFYETAISAQREHEEKKIPYLANLLATIAFDPHIDVGMANYMVRIASSLTYRQYCILNIAVNVTAWGGIHSPPYNNPENIATQVWTLLLGYERYRYSY